MDSATATSTAAVSLCVCVLERKEGAAQSKKRAKRRRWLAFSTF
jgi:hypothetical protein